MLYWTRSDKFDFFSSEERVECLRKYTFLGKTTLQRKGKTLSNSLVGLAFAIWNVNWKLHENIVMWLSQNLLKLERYLNIGYLKKNIIGRERKQFIKPRQELNKKLITSDRIIKVKY